MCFFGIIGRWPMMSRRASLSFGKSMSSIFSIHNETGWYMEWFVKDFLQPFAEAGSSEYLVPLARSALLFTSSNLWLSRMSIQKRCCEERRLHGASCVFLGRHDLLYVLHIVGDSCNLLTIPTTYLLIIIQLPCIHEP